MASNRIRALRKDNGYSQKELGDLLGVGQTTVSAWEIGRNEPDSESCSKMGYLLGSSIGYLMGYEAESKHHGLSDDEWDDYVMRRLSDRDEKQFLREIEERDEKKAEEYLKHESYKKWEQSERTVFPETIEIDAILERTDADGRRRAVEILERVFP